MCVIQHINVIKNISTYVCVCACAKEICPCQPKKHKMNVAKYFKTEVKEMHMRPLLHPPCPAH